MYEGCGLVLIGQLLGVHHEDELGQQVGSVAAADLDAVEVLPEVVFYHTGAVLVLLELLIVDQLVQDCNGC